MGMTITLAPLGKLRAGKRHLDAAVDLLRAAASTTDEAKRTRLVELAGQEAYTPAGFAPERWWETLAGAGGYYESHGLADQYLAKALDRAQARHAASTAQAIEGVLETLQVPIDPQDLGASTSRLQALSARVEAIIDDQPKRLRRAAAAAALVGVGYLGGRALD
jgi:hypothetical protein